MKILTRLSSVLDSMKKVTESREAARRPCRRYMSYLERLPWSLRVEDLYRLDVNEWVVLALWGAEEPEGQVCAVAGGGPAEPRGPRGGV